MERGPYRHNEGKDSERGTGSLQRGRGSLTGPYSAEADKRVRDGAWIRGAGVSDRSGDAGDGWKATFKMQAGSPSLKKQGNKHLLETWNEHSQLTHDFSPLSPL